MLTPIPDDLEEFEATKEQTDGVQATLDEEEQEVMATATEDQAAAEAAKAEAAKAEAEAAKAEAAEAEAEAAAKAAEKPKGNEAQLARLRNEAAEARKKASEAEKATAALQKQIDDANAAKLADEKKWEDLYKSEAAKREAAEKKAGDAEKRARIRYAKAELRTAAVAAGILDRDDVALIDTSSLADLESESEVSDAVNELVEKFKSSKPHKFKRPDSKDDEVEAAKIAAAAAAKVKADAEAEAAEKRKTGGKSSPPPNPDAKHAEKTFSLRTKEAREEMLAAWESAGTHI